MREILQLHVYFRKIFVSFYTVLQSGLIEKFVRKYIFTFVTTSYEHPLRFFARWRNMNDLTCNSISLNTSSNICSSNSVHYYGIAYCGIIHTYERKRFNKGIYIETTKEGFFLISLGFVKFYCGEV